MRDATHPKRTCLLLSAFWVIPALIATIGFRVVPSRYNPGLGLAGIFAAQLLVWGAWAGWSWLIVVVSDRVPFARGQWLRAVLVHVPLCAFVVSVQILIISVVSDVFGLSGRISPLSAALTDLVGIARPLEQVAEYGVNSVVAVGVRQFGDLLVMVYVAVVGAYAAMRWYAQWQQSQVQAAQLGEDLARAQLQALQAQLNPHFLFNALNAVVTLIGRDPQAAQRTTIRLAELLRATLSSGSEAAIPLRQEISLTERYLDIELVRFPDRLSVAWDVPEQLLETPIPPFTLQPLVENAVRHAVSVNPAGGTVRVSATQVGRDLVLTVRDDGPGAQSAPRVTDGTGTAVANLRARLARAYGNHASLTLQARGAVGSLRDGTAHGMDAVVRIPGVVLEASTAESTH